MFPVKEYLSLSRAFITTQKSFATSQTALRKKSTYEYEPFSHLREAIGFKFHSRKKGNQERQKAFSLKLFQTSSESRPYLYEKAFVHYFSYTCQNDDTIVYLEILFRHIKVQRQVSIVGGQTAV